MSKLVKLFTRMLWDIGRGYGALEVKEFIKYILTLNVDDRKKEEIVKEALQIAAALKTSGRPDLLDILVETAFKDEKEKLDLQKIKEFIRIMATHTNITKNRLRSIYLQALL